jgi:hypothetical protein
MFARLKKSLPVSVLRRIAPLWVACLIVGSLLPGEAKTVIGCSRLSQQHLHRLYIPTGEWKHRAFHIIGFGATALLFLIIARTGAAELVSIVGVLVLGAAIEFAQVLVYANRLETEDIRDDAYGVVAVYGIWLLTSAALACKAKADVGRARAGGRF